MTIKTEGVPTTGKKASDARSAGILFTLGSALFLLLTTASESIYPNFSLRKDAISDLAALGTSTTLIEGTALLGFAACWIAGAYHLFRDMGNDSLMVLNILPGVGFLLAGLSPENVNVLIHSVGAVLAFVPGGVVAILSYGMIRSQFRYFSVLLGAVSLAATFVIFAGWRMVPCVACGYTQALNQLLLGLGGWESMIVYPLLIWLVGFGSYLLAAEPRQAPGAK